jgi:signal transduction histidine kinase
MDTVPGRVDLVSAKRILIISQDPEFRTELRAALGDAGVEAIEASSAAESMTASSDEIHAVVLDRAAFLAADADGTIDYVATQGLHVPFLMRRGAFSVVPYPVDGVHLVLQIEQAMRHRDLSSHNAALQRSLDVHERLAMIGKLAAGVAHELNNPLDGVLRFVNLAADSLPREAPELPYLHEARRGLRRMADIVRDLLQFSRNASVEITDEDGERLAREAIEQVLSREPNKRVETSFDFPAGGIALPRAMFQVVANLAKNAVDSMPAQGSLLLSATTRDGSIRLAVADTGCGIPEHVQERVFEPFFTTKEVGEGSGLGLPICQRIVERLGGSLAMESEGGAGTRVTIELPSRRGLVAQQPPRTESTPIDAVMESATAPAAEE